MKGSVKLGSTYSGYQVILVALGTFGQDLQVRHSMGRDEVRKWGGLLWSARQVMVNIGHG